jgi:SRSO17 transposase
VGLAAGASPAGRPAGRRAGADGVGGGRHRLPKDGTHSVGVQRQYGGTLGKTANCQLGVSVNAVTEQASCPLDWRLVVPESWDDPAMAERRTACICPSRSTIGRSGSWCWTWWMSSAPGLGAAGAGRRRRLRRGRRVPQGLDDRQIPYVVQVKGDTSAYPEQVHPTTAPYQGRGRRPRPRYRQQPCSLKQLALTAGQATGVKVIWRRGSKGLQRSRFPALRVRPAGITPRRQAAARAEGVRWELPVRWLLVEWPTSKPEPVKSWLSNLPETTPMVELVRLGKLRWRIEVCQPQCTHIRGLAA